MTKLFALFYTIAIIIYMIQQIKNIFSSVILPEDKIEAFQAGAIYRNNFTKKRLIVTGVLNGYVEFVEEEDSSEFSYTTLKYVNIEKNKMPALDFITFLNNSGYQDKN